MPIYEYVCSDCGKHFEEMHGMNETPKISCESCDGKNVQRVMSAGAFHFKGSGFYQTDYKKKPKAASCESCAESGRCPAAK